MYGPKLRSCYLFYAVSSWSLTCECTVSCECTASHSCCCWLVRVHFDIAIFTSICMRTSTACGAICVMYSQPTLASSSEHGSRVLATAHIVHVYLQHSDECRRAYDTLKEKIDNYQPSPPARDVETSDSSTTLMSVPPPPPPPTPGLSMSSTSFSSSAAKM